MHKHDKPTHLTFYDHFYVRRKTHNPSNLKRPIKSPHNNSSRSSTHITQLSPDTRGSPRTICGHFHVDDHHHHHQISRSDGSRSRRRLSSIRRANERFTLRLRSYLSNSILLRDAVEHAEVS